MLVQQLSVFIENRQGRLADFTRVLGENDIDLIALSIADTAQFGILRAIVNKNEEAVACLQEAGYTARLNSVLAVAVPDEPGGLNKALATLNENNISIEYLYTFMRRIGDDAVIIFRVTDAEEAQKILTEKGVRILTQDEIC